MARRSTGKPYDIAVKKAAQFKEELIVLPTKYIEAILPFLKPNLTEDDFHQMVYFCYSAHGRTDDWFVRKTTEAIRDYFTERQRENSILYNPYKNISLNQCVGDSRSPVSDWLNTSDWREWD